MDGFPTPYHLQAFPKELNLMGKEAEYGRSDDDVLKELPFKLAPRVTKAGTYAQHVHSLDSIHLSRRHCGYYVSNATRPTAIYFLPGYTHAQTG